MPKGIPVGIVHLVDTIPGFDLVVGEKEARILLDWHEADCKAREKAAVLAALERINSASDEAYDHGDIITHRFNGDRSEEEIDAIRKEYEDHPQV